MGAWRRGRILSGATAIAAVAAIAAGCGSSSSSGSSSSVSSAASGGSSAGSSTGSSKKLTIAYVAYSLQAANQQYLNQGFQSEAKKYGYTTKTVDAGGDVGKANQLMQSLVTQKVDAIVFDSFGTQAMQAGILAAKAAHIPVYAAYNWGTPVNVAASIEAGAAQQETDTMLSAMSGGKGSVLAFTLPAGANCVNGVATFKSIMAKHPGIKVTYHATVAPGWQVDANNATAAWLKSNPTPPLAVWGCWDGPSVGATAAITAAGLTKSVKVYGDYGEADAINAIKAGKYTATWYFDGITLGQKVVQLMHANAGTPYDQIKGAFVKLSPIEVDQSNVSQFIKQHPEAVAGS